MNSGGHGAWQRRGGGTLLVAASLLVVATVAEYFVLGPGAPAIVFAVFLVLFGASTILFALAAVLVASGTLRWGPGGIVGDSPLGHLALYAYGVLWLISQAAYIGYTYVFPASSVNYYLLAVSTILLYLSTVCGIVAATVIARRHVARGFARWSLFVALGVSIAVGFVLGAKPNQIGVQTVAETVSALGQVVVGVSYYRAQGADRGATRRRP